MKVRVNIMLKVGVLDPQGDAVMSALGNLGFEGVENVRQGKVIFLEVADGTSLDDIDDMCTKLLVNTVIEDYQVDIE